MKKRELLSYIRKTQPGIKVWEEKQIMGRVKMCSDVIKRKIIELIAGEEDRQFGYTFEGKNGETITLTAGTLINDFGLQPLQAFLFLDWVGKDSSSALSFLQRHDYLQLSSQDDKQDDRHDEPDLNEEI